jgi:hypothetical protein
MHMLGARLTSYQRKLTGKWCKEIDILFNFFPYTDTD